MSVDFNVRPLDGERFFPVAVGLHVLGGVLDGRLATRAASGQALVLDVDWPAFAANRSIFHAEDEPMLTHLLHHATTATTAPAAPSSSSPVAAVIGRASQLGVAHAYELHLGADCGPWKGLRQHVMHGVPVCPGTAYLSWALEVLKTAHGATSAVLSNVRFVRVLDLSQRRRCILSLMPKPTQPTQGSLVVSCDGVVHAAMDFAFSRAADAAAHPHPQLFTSSAPPEEERSEEERRVDDPYGLFASQGYQYGPAFARLRRLSTDGRAAHAELAADPEAEVEEAAAAQGAAASGPAAFSLCPAVLDAALQLPSFLEDGGGTSGVPISLGELHWLGNAAPPRAARAVAVASETSDVQFHVELASGGGAPVAVALRFAMREPAPPPASACKVLKWSVEPSDTAPRMPRGTQLVRLEAAAQEEAPLAFLRRVRAAAELGPVAVGVPAGGSGLPPTPAALAAVGGAFDLGLPAYDLASGARLEERLEEPPRASEEFEVVLTEDDHYAVGLDVASGSVRFEGRRRQGSLGDEEVEVLTELWALNFRDLLVAKGVIPTATAGESLGIGGEALGVVTRVGSGVSGVAVGERVVCLPPDGMGRYLVTDARWVARVPPGMADEDAVSGTMVYATAWLGLLTMARVRAGESVLIHSAAGGVGLAAVHLSLRAGCVVYATASTAEKRAALLALGVRAVFNSRSHAEFSQGLLEATDGEGVDVLLNSLGGDAARASLKLLKPFGRFVEIGKRDAYAGAHLSMAHFLRAITFAAAHVDVLMIERPLEARKLFDEVQAALPSLPRLPHTTYPMARLDDALAFMATGKHIGKLLVATRDPVAVGPCLPGLLGPPDDPLALGLRRVLGPATDRRGACVALPDVLPASDHGGAEEEEEEENGDARLEGRVRGADSVVTPSLLVAQAALRLGVRCAVCVRAPWQGLPAQTARDALAESGLVVVQGSSGSDDHAGAPIGGMAGGDCDGDDGEWLLHLVREVAGASVEDLQECTPFEEVGIDSLLMITLARRISTRTGNLLAAEMLTEIDSVASVRQRLRDARGLSARPSPPPPPAQAAAAAVPSALAPARPRVLCLHGFRDSAAVLKAQLAPLLTAFGNSFEFVFVDAPAPASGPMAPGAPEGVPGYEWWGVPGGPFESAWTGGFERAEPALAALEARGPYDGAIGFSQGAAVAAMLDVRWLVCFSAVAPPPRAPSAGDGAPRPWRPRRDGRQPSFHCYDLSEEVAAQCEHVQRAFEREPVAVHHSEGHRIPKAASVAARLREFLEARAAGE